MAKELVYAELFEQYKDLLTPHKRKLFYEYYLLDLSLGEIAEMNGISRQSVNDGIKKAKEQLSAFEAALHAAEKYGKLVKFGEKLRMKDAGLYEDFSDIIKD